MQSEYRKILKAVWEYDGFRSIQEDIVESIGEGKDTLGLMPTGGGKSITFQVPALVAEGMCLVITPLIALMVDQVEKLKKLGIRAEALHSGLGRHEMKVKLDNALYGGYKILYISPERLDSEVFRSRLEHMKISFLTIDEAHCISQWGYDFRPSYLKIASVRDILPKVPILALTATATPEVVEDIQLKLAFRQKNAIKTTFYRNNLVYFVRQTESKLADLVKVVKSIDGTGIIYVRSRKKTKEISDLLRQERIVSDYFHAGLGYTIRQQKQADWTSGKTRIIVATNAFGMGIDKPDVRFVVHVDLPDSPEEYFQEAGRGGRDGKKAFAVLLFSGRDKSVLSKRLADSFPEINYIKDVYDGLSNFLSISLGAGKGMSFDFNLHNFVKAYKLNPTHAYNAIKILEQQGYLELSDELQNPSRVFFIINRDDLYKFQVENAKFDGFLKLVLRSYTGLFSDYININEELLAQRAGLSRDQVYQYFVRLTQLNIIKYIPGRKTPLLVFLEERLPKKSLFISPDSYKKRKERYKKRLDAMYYYASDLNTCRSVILLNYFGESDVESCGKCDYCRDRHDGRARPDLTGVKVEIIKLLRNKPLEPDKLAELLKVDSKTLSLLVRDLMDLGEIAYNDSSELELKGKSEL